MNLKNRYAKRKRRNKPRDLYVSSHAYRQAPVHMKVFRMLLSYSWIRIWYTFIWTTQNNEIWKVSFDHLSQKLASHFIGWLKKNLDRTIDFYFFYVLYYVWQGHLVRKFSEIRLSPQSNPKCLIRNHSCNYDCWATQIKITWPEIKSRRSSILFVVAIRFDCMHRFSLGIRLLRKVYISWKEGNWLYRMTYNKNFLEICPQES